MHGHPPLEGHDLCQQVVPAVALQLVMVVEGHSGVMIEALVMALVLALALANMNVVAMTAAAVLGGGSERHLLLSPGHAP